jgi:hypothetical protein
MPRNSSIQSKTTWWSDIGHAMTAARALAQALGEAKQQGRALSRDDVNALLQGSVGDPGEGDGAGSLSGGASG